MPKPLLAALSVPVRAGVMVASVVGGLAVSPQLASAATGLSVSATGSFVSEYMFRGLRLNAAGFQPAVEFDAGSLALGAVGNFPLRDKVRDSADPEIDLYGSYTVATGSGVSVTPGFTSYHFPHAPTNAGSYRSTFEPSLALSYTLKGIRFVPKVYYDVVLDGPTFELSAYYAYPLQQIGTELDLVATAGTYEWKDFARDATPAVKAWGDYWLLGATVPVQISSRSRVAIGFAYTEGSNAFLKTGPRGKIANPRASGRGVATLSYTFTF